MREAQRRLTPPRPRPEEPQTLPELLASIREDPSYPALAADWLCTALKDRKSYSGFKARCEEAWRGESAGGAAAVGIRAGDGPEGQERGCDLYVYTQCAPAQGP